MKRRHSILAVLILMAAGLTGCAQPAATVRNLGKAAEPVFHVQVNGLNLRECPSTGCPILAVLGRGEPVAVLMVKDGWSEVRTQRGGKTGWVSSRYLDSRPPASQKGGSPPSVKAPSLPEEEFAPAAPAQQAPEVEEEFAPAGKDGRQENVTSPPPVSEEFGK